MKNKQPLITVTYILANGQAIQIDVTLGVAIALKETDNKLLAIIKQDKRHIDLSEYVEGETEAKTLMMQEDVADVVERLESYAQLHNAITLLPEIQRRRIIARFFEGFSCAEIADMEGIRHHSVNASIRVALKNLSKLLELPYILTD